MYLTRKRREKRVEKTRGSRTKDGENVGKDRD